MLITKSLVRQLGVLYVDLFDEARTRSADRFGDNQGNQSDGAH